MTQQRNPDGSWSDAIPLGWQGRGIDWEVYRSGDKKPADCYPLSWWVAQAYDEDVLVAEVYAKSLRRLSRKMRKALGDNRG